jgi:hypothetical protein
VTNNIKFLSIGGFHQIFNIHRITKTSMKMISREIWAILFLLPLLTMAAPSKNEKEMKGPVFVKEPENRIGNFMPRSFTFHHNRLNLV